MVYGRAALIDALGQTLPGLLPQPEFPPSGEVYAQLLASFSHTRYADIRLSQARILLKQLPLAPDHRPVLDSRLTQFRIELYRLGCPQAAKYLLRGFQQRPSRSGLLMLVCALCGLTFPRYLSLHRWLSHYIAPRTHPFHGQRV